MTREDEAQRVGGVDGDLPPTQPHIERTPFEPIEPPQTITLYFCPACGMRIQGSYNLEPARKRCTKTWHRATVVQQSYVAVGAGADLIDEIVAALTGDSNDAEHDALASVAEALGIRWVKEDEDA